MINKTMLKTSRVYYLVSSEKNKFQAVSFNRDRRERYDMKHIHKHLSELELGRKKNRRNYAFENQVIEYILKLFSYLTDLK